MKSLTTVSIRAIVLFTAWGAAATAAAQYHPPVDASGMPCVKEVCVWQDVKTLPALAWQVAISSFTLGTPASKIDYELGSSPGQEKDVVADAKAKALFMPYFSHTSRLDAEGFRRLANIRGLCKPIAYSARYTSPAGNPTELIIHSFLEGDGVQRFRVTQIRRTFNTQQSSESQVRQLKKEFADRYQSVKQKAIMPDKQVPSWDFSGPHLSLRAAGKYTLGDRGESADRYRNFPGCGQKLKAD